jgi:hypothetical protein
VPALRRAPGARSLSAVFGGPWRASLVTTRSGDRSRRDLERLGAWVHRLEPEWWTTAITFQRGPVWVSVSGTRWRLQTSFYGARWGWTRNSNVRYGVSLMLSSSDLTRRQLLALRRSKTFAAVTAVFKRLGYRGQWHRGGPFGLYSKELRSQQALRREVERLQSVSFKVLLAEGGRRTSG